MTNQQEKVKVRKSAIRCEGWRRYGGAFTLGPVTWKQCEEAAIVQLKFRQDGKVDTLPACQTCWDECIENDIKIIKATPLTHQSKG